ncbi:hypothetical protein W1080910_067 [Cyanophage S-RIM12 isolate W1_08_0910]|uniref:Uncharacterized protein n=3 Tax=Brizovirus TaxID=2733098 RepID=A0A1D7SNV1_9CAUD|nr:hypothetical protein HOQ65_gp169 [Cyanophage S-RIM12 isolate RW_06_0310]YP_009779476.1 hypothetical protein HOQ66_gp169 [Cyanophage S-RIM12 isolate W1_08_0910]AOO15340.1 hypothetical protein Np150310_066 [Cyanophage S-RIM12_Np_15_0310]AOO15980.1 hypothetical protein RW040310_066 [Cyanophage S-RIM12_RW_04_0310]AOO19200.1 hypothetical protein WH050310_066 [Cyanophage S-RIM12_WH_05_0310]MAR18444.1 hypothetical protein [Paracoccaceae bacterium]AOO16409.1 hypothetical protein RW060310_067 [Cyan
MYLPKADWNRATYRELKEILNELPERYLDQTATVCCDDEYQGFSIAWTGEAHQVLDADHMFFNCD